MDCLLGIDVGSTSMKALVYDLDGKMIKLYFVEPKAWVWVR